MNAFFEIDDRNGLAYRWHPPASEAAPSFVFVNALTGSLESWEAVVAPALREHGFGTLSYNFRGQAESPFAPDLELTPEVIVKDLGALLREIAPPRPILCGLSIGGLFAAQALDQGFSAAGLVLLNTLREIGPRIAWINDALPKIVAEGGLPLFSDALMPLLVGPAFAAKARQNALRGGYDPLPPDHGHMNLLRNAGSADWAFDWASLKLPTLVITGHQDRIFLDRDIVDRLAAQIPDARREDYPHVGHLIPMEAPDHLVASLARFGRELSQ